MMRPFCIYRVDVKNYTTVTMNLGPCRFMIYFDGDVPDFINGEYKSNYNGENS